MTIRGVRVRVMDNDSSRKISEANLLLDDDGNVYVRDGGICLVCEGYIALKLGTAYMQPQTLSIEPEQISPRVCIDCHDIIMMKQSKLNWILRNGKST